MLVNNQQIRRWHSVMLWLTISLIFVCLAACDDDDKHHFYWYVDTEFVTTPNRPIGPGAAEIGQAVTFQTSGSYSSHDHTVQYRFNLGNGVITAFSYNNFATYGYLGPGVYFINAQAFTSDGGKAVYSSWSELFPIQINQPQQAEIAISEISLRSTWQTADQKLWTVGDQGVVICQDNSGQQLKQISDQDLYGIWGNEQSLYCCGAGGTLLRYDGKNWQPCNPGVAEKLQAIAGSEDTILVAGEKGTIVQGCGDSWQRQQVPTIASLHGLWVENTLSAFAVGTTGTILYYNGVDWQTMSSPSSQDLYAIWGNRYDDVWAVGAAGTLLHFNGASWSQLPLDTKVNLLTVRGVRGFEVYIAGDEGFISSLTAERSPCRLTMGKKLRLYAVWPLPEQKSIYLAGEHGTLSQISNQ